jgi:hypothetical protein
MMTDKRQTLINREKLFLFFCLCLSVSLGLLVRAPYFILYDFPLNDGGLFKQMIDELRLNHYILPECIEYNRVRIPFAYPPLAFYLAAFASDSLGLSVIDVERYMPLVFNILSIGVFVLLASELQNRNKTTILYASLLFPLIPRSYEWLIMGGGITRSVGFLFTLVATYQANRILSIHDRKAFGWCLLFLCAAMLSHLEWGITAFVSVSLIIFFRWSCRRGLYMVAALGVMVLVLTAPWWMTMLVRHGPLPFMAASSTSWGFLSLGDLVSYLGWLAAIGFISSVVKRD